MRGWEGYTLELGLPKGRGACVGVRDERVGVPFQGTMKRVGVPVLSLELGLGLIYTKLHKNFVECSGTFHLFYAYLLYSTGFYPTNLGNF